ncbi:MAG: adenylate/guanylate cyclase domain-containing protein [Chlamydiae bacterium]|nr:adenylate/guanylate cyclase domain-containing protein [Chlamydiota bacterium]
MRLRVKILSSVSMVCLIGFATYIILQQVTISRKLGVAETKVQEEIIQQNEEKRLSLERYLRSVLSDSQVRTNMFLMKINQYRYVRDQFVPSPEMYEKGTWFEAGSTLLLDPWLDFIQVENEDKITSLYALEPPYASGFWHFTGAPGIEIFAKYDSKGNVVGPYIGVPVWMGPLVDYSEFKNPDLKNQPEQTSFWLLFNPQDILKLFETKLDITTLSNPIHPLQISVWVKNDEAYQAICETMVANIKTVHQNLLTPQAKELYNILNSPQATSWLQQKLEPLKGQIKQGETVYEKLEKISQSSLDNQDIVPVKYEEMSRRWDLMRFLWEFSAIYLSGVFGNDPNAPQAPDGFARIQGDNPKGLGFIWVDVAPDTPFKLFDPTGISGGFDNDLEKLNGGIGIIYNPNDPRIFIGNRLQLNYLDPTTNKNRSGGIMAGIDASKFLQKVAIATQESTFLVVGDKVLRAYKPDGSVERQIMLTPDIISRMKKYPHGVTQDALGNEYIFFRIQPYQDMDMELFVFKLKSNEIDILQNLARDIKNLLRSLTLEMYVFGMILSIAIIALLYYLLSSVLKPIITLADTVEKVGRGKEENINFEGSLEDQPDELRALYSNFDAMLKRMKDGERSKNVLNKFLAPEIAEKILSDESSLHGKQVLATVFFFDFRKFTELTEAMPADQMIQMLNSYFNEIVLILKRNHGIIDKFQGDAILAVWGVPDENPQGPLYSVRAALEIQKRIKELNEIRKKESKTTMEAGIGIHYAKVTEGIMGSSDHSEFTVIGSAVNIASRVCDEASGGEIWITTNVYDQVVGQVVVECVGEHKFEGISQPYTLYKVTG